MSGGRLDGLQVLVTGIGPLISRDVVGLLLAEGALVTAADRDGGVISRFQRDLGLYRKTAETALIELFSLSEMRPFAADMQSLGKMPHLIVCCCEGDACPAALAAWLLQPSFVLHAAPCAGTGLRRAFAGMSAPRFADLLERSRRRGVFNPGAWPRRVSIAGHVFSVRREELPAERASSRPRGRLQVARRATRAGRAPKETFGPQQPHHLARQRGARAGRAS